MVKDNQNLRYQWLDGDGSEVTENDYITIDRNVLTIQHFEKNYEGTYTCIVSTPYNMLSMSAEVMLHLHG